MGYDWSFLRRKSVAGLALVLSVTVWVPPVSGATETVTGKVIGLWCYWLNEANTERDHQGPGFQGSPRGPECAMACVKWDGAPVGLLTADGKVYQLTGGLTSESNAHIAPHLAHIVTVTGDVYEKDGTMMLSAPLSSLTMVK